MGGSSRGRLGIALGAALAIEAVGLAVGFGLSEPTSLRPDYSDPLLGLDVLLPAECVAVAAIVIALARRKPGAAWWAVASATAILAVSVQLLEAGAGGWSTWCAIALLASFTGIVLSLLPTGRPVPEGGDDRGAAPGRLTGKAATALAVVALVASMSMGEGMEDVDYSGTWTAGRDDLTLTLTGGQDGGQYTLRWGTCTEQSDWTLDYPQMTTSVQVWLIRETGATSTCLPGTKNIMLRVSGGTAAAPTLALPGPDGKTWTLTRG
ncbi:hypothetical protein ACFYNM_39870 [Streptomyces spororaveus]|uniref:hypothetical protein n=1 Tax=Streptomyces spororaveus TaxID=284039 RepID=UPI00367A8A94